jgi:hypothetical protein
MEKNPNDSLHDLVKMLRSMLGVDDRCFCEIKWLYLLKYVHNHHQKD